MTTDPMPGTPVPTKFPPEVDPRCCRKIVIGDVPGVRFGHVGGVYMNTGKQYNGKDQSSKFN